MAQYSRHTPHSSKNATVKSQHQLRYKSSKQTKITDFLQEAKLAKTENRGEYADTNTHKTDVKVNEVYEFDKSKYTVCLSKLSGIDARITLLASYPLFSSTVPWHSVGIIRLMEDVNKILSAKGYKPFQYHEFTDALLTLQSLGLIKVVDGSVVNFKNCE